MRRLQLLEPEQGDAGPARGALDGTRPVNQLMNVPCTCHTFRPRRPASALALVLLVAAGSMLPASALAQRVILLPLAAADQQDAAAKVAQSAAADALGMQGLKVLLWEAATAQLPTGERARCEDVAACTPKVMQVTSSELAAGVVISRNAQRVSERIRVALLDKDRHRYDGEAKVENGDVRGATTRALLEARSFQLLGPGPWLQVEGTPEGAEVLLDDRVVGRLPYRASIAAGSHKLRVREGGYTAVEQVIDVPASDTHRARVVVALEPAPFVAAGQGEELRAVDLEPQGRAEQDDTWIVWPIVVGSVGVVLAGVTSVRLATGIDHCVNPDIARHCTERRSVNWVPTVLAYSVSAALVGTSVVWIVAGMNEERPGLAARVGLDGVSLTGSF